ncbi:MAG TPA: CPBP family intramembrane glutamic endopeptidase [Gammaproteobacteria bacterium]|nr:CPBP family intramembrane glutamic endopeptidase [Gammaproteobacteria bacterium]
MRDRSVVLELGAIAAAALVFVATFQVRPPYLDFVLAAAAVALIVLSAARSRRLWELQRSVDPTGARGAWKAALVFTGAALVVLAGAGVLAARAAGTPATPRFGNWHMLVVAALYFPWALLQQYIFMFYWFGRWLRLVPVPVAVALTAVAFAAVHFPRWPVMGVTLVAGSVWALIYYRWRSIVPLAVSHALLGTALHYWVFGNDLLERWIPLLDRWLP